MKAKKTAFSILGRITWKVLAFLGVKWAKDKLATDPKRRQV